MKEEILNLFELYLLNQASFEEKQLLINSIKNDISLNQWLESQIMNSSKTIDVDIKLRILNNIRQEIESEKEVPKQVKRSALYKITAIAASILIPLSLITAGYLYTAQNNNGQEVSPLPLVVAVDMGQKAHIVLPDGSKVWINSDSKLTYMNNFNIKDRRLILNGEAYFEVTPNADKVFIVECLDMEIEVLGTSFSVKAYDKDNIISAVLSTGKIQMSVPHNVLELRPNDRIIYNRKSKELDQSVVNANEFTAWTQNRLRFENETLEDIFISISRMHNVEYSFENKDIKLLRFTGTLDNNSLKNILDVICQTAPVSYEILNGKVYVYKNEQQQKYFN